MRRKFSLLEKIRNKIKIKGEVNLLIAKSSKIVDCFIVIKGNNNTLKIAPNTFIRNSKIEIIGDNCSEIDENCMIGENCYLSAKEGKTVKIKRDSVLSRNIKLMTSDGHPIFTNTKRINLAKDITIGKNVWIADNVTILKGVEIGTNSVVGINSTVTKSVKESSIVVGNPAKVVKDNIYWKE